MDKNYTESFGKRKCSLEDIKCNQNEIKKNISSIMIQTEDGRVVISNDVQEHQRYLYQLGESMKVGIKHYVVIGTAVTRLTHMVLVKQV
tara:strand:- start:65139 stop:65405 length:267 start_codon:yes stop_codon:yes gene_type:complete